MQRASEITFIAFTNRRNLLQGVGCYSNISPPVKLHELVIALSTPALKHRWQDHPIFGFVDWVLRGIGQVVFQNNPISGAIILAGIFYNSVIYGTVCLLGTIISTASALLLMLLAKNGFSILIPVAPSDTTTPEEHLARFSASQKR